MKENTARVVAQLPIDVATYLLNEKRTVLEEIEKRHTSDIVLVPNLHLETPHYDINRIRTNDLTPEMKSKQSFELMTEPVTEISAGPTAQAVKSIEEPAIKTVMPEAPVPPPPPAAQIGIFVRLWRALFGTGASKPRKPAAPARKPGKQFQQQRGRKQQAQGQQQRRRPAPQQQQAPRRENKEAQQQTKQPAQETASAAAGSTPQQGASSGQGNRRGRRGGRRRRDSGQQRQQQAGSGGEQRGEAKRNNGNTGGATTAQAPASAQTATGKSESTAESGRPSQPSAPEQKSNREPVNTPSASPAPVYEAPRPAPAPAAPSPEPVRHEPPVTRPTGSDDNS